jgi:hypothetical protein
MRSYLRRLRTELRHRYDEFFEATKGRRECAFEVQLRNRLLDATRDTVALAEACLDELRRQEAMFYAPYKPGDRVLVEYQVEGATVTRGPYLVIDVCPDKRGRFHYEAVSLTKRGTMHARRAPQWLFPRSIAAMRLSEAPVCEEAEREARYFRECSQMSRVLAYERGDLTLFEVVEGYFGSRSYRRKDRMSL